MNWQTKIFNKYRLYEKGIKIFYVYTGLLFDPELSDFLLQENKSVILVNSAPEILENLDVTDKIIIGNNFNVPVFIRNKNEVFDFRYSNIPVNGNTDLLSGLTINELVGLLAYVEESEPHAVISEQYLREIMPKVKNWLEIKSLNELTTKIEKLLQEPVSLENVVQISINYAELQFKSYKSKNKECLEIIPDIDNNCNHYFEEEKRRKAFY